MKCSAGEGCRRSVEPILLEMKKLYVDGVNKERNIIHTMKRMKANWIGHISRWNCLLKHVIEEEIEGRMEVTGRRGKRHKQLLDDLKGTRVYWKLKEEAVYYTLRRTDFVRGCGTVVGRLRE